MIAVFRVDASTEMGTGHLMRCLTLAAKLEERGARCEFVSRELPGNLIDLVTLKGFKIHSLPEPHDSIDAISEIPHASWLRVDWEEDATQTALILADIKADWLIVDHYALDAQWEREVTPWVGRLMVIDDLADRIHCCEILLDQNLGRSTEHYEGRVPEHCQMMIGPHYVLLRDEFSRLRKKSLQRRRSVALSRVLVTLGGADKDNVTSSVIAALEASSLPGATIIDIVVGGASPHYEAIVEQAGQSRFETDVSVNVSDMALRMAKADLAIGAAGGTTWERFCMGLPALLVCLAENQKKFLEPLMNSGAIRLADLGTLSDEIASFVIEMHRFPGRLNEMSEKAATLIDGAGAERVVNMMLDGYHE